jgi:hypothetical protein
LYFFLKISGSSTAAFISALAASPLAFTLQKFAQIYICETNIFKNA